jgi:hypothetical protein
VWHSRFQNETPPSGFGWPVYQCGAVQPGDVVQFGTGVKRYGTSVVGNKGRGSATGTALRGYCVAGNLPEMPYLWTELVKAHAAGGSWGRSMSGR